MPTDGLSEAVCLIFISLPGETVFTQWDLATIHPWFCVLTVVATLIAVRVAVGSLYPEVTSRAGLVNAAAVTTAVFIEVLACPCENPICGARPLNRVEVTFVGRSSDAVID